MIWWLKPAHLCLHEKFIIPSDCQFQVGSIVPSTTSEGGISRACGAGLGSELRAFTSAFSIRLIALEGVPALHEDVSEPLYENPGCPFLIRCQQFSTVAYPSVGIAPEGLDDEKLGHRQAT